MLRSLVGSEMCIRDRSRSWSRGRSVSKTRRYPSPSPRRVSKSPSNNSRGRSRSRARSRSRRRSISGARGRAAGRRSHYMVSRSRSRSRGRGVQKKKTWIAVSPCIISDNITVDEETKRTVTVMLKDQYFFRSNSEFMVKMTKWTGQDHVCLLYTSDAADE